MEREDLMLNLEETQNLLPPEIRNFRVGGLPYVPMTVEVATAAAAKAAWACVAWLEAEPSDFATRSAALGIRLELERLGIQRP